MALLAATAMTKPPTAQRTWGWARIEILAAEAQAAMLAVGIFAFVEGLQRLLAPRPSRPGNAPPGHSRP